MAIARTSSQSGANYRTVFKSWDRRAWVRSKPRRGFLSAADRQYFSLHAAPLVREAAKLSLPDRVINELLVHHLYAYLEFTVWLELGVVNRVCSALRTSDIFPWMPDRMRHDALRVYTDEGAHAEMCSHLMAEVVVATGLKPVPHVPEFVNRLERLGLDNRHVSRELLVLVFAIVSETLLSTTLDYLPTDEAVQGPVREVLADHAADEKRHSAYFGQVLRELWPRIDAPTKKALSALLPRMLRGFLEPDGALLNSILRTCCPDIGDSESVVESALERDDTLEYMARAVRPTVLLFRELDFVIDLGAREADESPISEASRDRK